MFHMRFLYNKEPNDKNDVKIIAIRCSNGVKEKGYLWIILIPIKKI